MATGMLAGRTLGHYVLLDPLGEGGMGTVYRARDRRLGRLAALKVIRAESTDDPERRRRFVREAKAASALDHPGIVTIYEIDTADGVDFIAMEYVAGGTLAELLAGGALPVERALRLAVQIADALAAAHAAGVVHRDLKPSNIMLTADERAKIADFGLAKLLGSAQATRATAEKLTASGALIGTTPYMSPEQVAGREVDARSDLFSFGTILYEMLMGRRPFGGDSVPGTLAAILRDAPAPVVGVPPGVAQLVERCLRKAAGERFQTASELKAALESCLAPRTASSRPSIAVLPFRNMSGAEEDGFLCEGLAEEIIDALTRIAGLRVIARTSSFAVGRMELDVREIGARLDVGQVLEGSVRRAGRRIRVTAQLVTTDDASHLWSERYDRELTDVLALEEEIAAAIAGRLRVELEHTGRERPPVDPEAHAAYLEGRYHFARSTPAALALAKAAYERALARDPGSALAHDGLAELYWYLGLFAAMPPRDAFAQSTWHAMRALELDDTLAQTHALLGMLRKELDYNWPEVERENQRALALGPGSPLVHLRYAISGLLPLGRAAEALRELEEVVRVDPLSVFSRWWLAVMAHIARQPERMIAEGRQMLALDPNHFLGHWVSGMGHHDLGAGDEAVPALARANELAGRSPFTLGFLALVSGRFGQRDAALRLLDEAGARAQAGYMPPSVFFLGQVGLGNWDSALEWMDRAIEGRDPLIMPIKSYPFLDPVRHDPRFHALLRKMHLA